MIGMYWSRPPKSETADKHLKHRCHQESQGSSAGADPGGGRFNHLTLLERNGAAKTMEPDGSLLWLRFQLLGVPIHANVSGQLDASRSFKVHDLSDQTPVQHVVR